MTDKLKCPFCGSELRTSMLDEPVAWYCPNRCIGTYEPKVWRALIAGEKARHALKEIVNFFDTECGKDDLYFYNLIEDNIAKYREITSVTKQGE